MDTLSKYIQHMEEDGLSFNAIIRIDYSNKWDVTRVTFDLKKCFYKNKVKGARYLEQPIIGNHVEELNLYREIYDSKLGQLL